MSSSDDSLKNMQEYAAKYITGGMASSFRANQFTGVPMYIKEASGPRFTDISGKEYIDFVSQTSGTEGVRSCHPKVVEAVKKQVEILSHTCSWMTSIPKIEMAEKLA